MYDITHYKQAAYKLQDDIRTYREDNLAFYRLMLEVAEKAFNQNDIASKEYLIQMIEDSITWEENLLEED